MELRIYGVALFLGMASWHPLAFSQVQSSSMSPSTAVSTYVGSGACKPCHSEIYGRWKNTRRANVVRDPKEHPDAILPDLSRPNPLVKFTKDDIAFVYGSKWKQRYFKKVGDEYFVFLHGGISQIRFGALTSSKMEPIGGRPSILQTT